MSLHSKQRPNIWQWRGSRSMFSIKILQSLFYIFPLSICSDFFFFLLARVRPSVEKKHFFFSRGTQYNNNNNNIFIQPAKSTEGLCFWRVVSRKENSIITHAHLYGIYETRAAIFSQKFVRSPIHHQPFRQHHIIAFGR